MSTQVALIGIGHSKISPTTPEYSYKELIHEAARAAYQDAGLNSHRDIDGFVTCAEDLIEGTSIFDEYTPDQLGAVQKPVHTVTGDTLHGLIVATMKIQTGLMDVVAVEAHSKASNIETYEHITHFALDPTWNRPLNVHPYFISGLDMNYYMKISKTTEAQVAAVVSKNKRHALKNELACCSENISTDQVLTSAYAFEPVREAFIAPHIDGAFVFVLAS
ncbi:MAG: acetyl-CoA acetyltransferase, partial [Deltaproteobacteria bacterium]|nr:acetyl-CoA acetyltransferase [Deltaproteobacteria bacterium]